MKSNKLTFLLLGGAVLSGLLCGYLVLDYIDDEVTTHKEELSRGQQMVQVVVATVNLKKGDSINNTTVSVKPIPNTYVHKGYISPEEFADIDGSRVIFPLSTGDPVLHSHITKETKKKSKSFSSLIQPGQRAITIPVDSLDTISGFLSPGDSVDLMITIKDGDLIRTLPFLKGVVVIATGSQLQRSAGGTDRGRFNEITLAVGTRDATKIIHAQSVADLSVILRSSQEGEEGQVDEYITIRNLVDLPQEVEVQPREKPKPRRSGEFGFEIIKGGKSS